MFATRHPQMPTTATALVGRTDALPTAQDHYVLGHPLKGPYPPRTEKILFGLGCFWGAERKFWQIGHGIHITAVGYVAGLTPNPTYDEVCTGRTGHNEAVLVVYHPDHLPLSQLLKVFWESHDPTLGYRQGNDVGTQYRSGIYTYTPDQLQSALASREAYGAALAQRNFGAITTEIFDAPTFYFAEEYHQQYLAKVPHGYCGLGGTGVSCPLPTPRSNS
jgi:peptide-methionine (S)-S-oxide reductase